MRDNNDVAREFLIKADYTDIWLKAHTKFLDKIWSHIVAWDKDKPIIEKYEAQDIWNLFDGICISKEGYAVFLAIGSQFKKISQLEHFLKNKKGFRVLMIQVQRQKVRLKEWKT